MYLSESDSYFLCQNRYLYKLINLSLFLGEAGLKSCHKFLIFEIRIRSRGKWINAFYSWNKDLIFFLTISPFIFSFFFFFYNILSIFTIFFFPLSFSLPFLLTFFLSSPFPCFFFFLSFFLP